MALAALLSPGCTGTAPAELRQALSSGSVDWEALAHLANRSGLAPALGAALKSSGMMRSAPEQLRAYLEEVHRFNTLRNEALLGQLAEVVRLLNGAGVTPLLLKGSAALATGLYPDPGSRFMWDLDLLVPEELMADAVAALLAGGYAVPEKYANRRIAVDWSQRHHTAPLMRSDGAATVELHRRITSPEWGILAPREIWRTALPCASPHLAGACAVILAPTDELIHCFVHAQLSHLHHSSMRVDLRHLHHFALLCHRHEAEIAWGHIAAMRRDPVLGRSFSPFLLMVQRLFLITLPLPDEPDRYAERYFRSVMAVQDGWRRRLHVGWLVTRELMWAFGEKRLREAYGDSDSPVMTLRLRYLQHLLGRYGRPDAWRARFGGL